MSGFWVLLRDDGNTVIAQSHDEQTIDDLLDTGDYDGMDVEKAFIADPVA